MPSRKNARTWVQRGLLAALVGTVLVFGLRANGSVASRLSTAGGAVWLVDPPMGALVRVNALAHDVTTAVKVADPRQELTAAQTGSGAVVLNRSTSAVGRVDGATLDYESGRTLASAGADLALVGSDRSAFAVDTSDGKLVALDPADLTTRYVASITAQQATPAVADTTGRLWAYDAALGELVRFDGVTGNVKRASVAEPGTVASLTLVADRPLLVDAANGAAIRIGANGSAGARLALGGSSRENVLVAGTSSGAGTPRLYSLFPDSGDLWTLNVDGGEPLSLQLNDEETANSSDGFGQPVALGNRLYVPVLVRTEAAGDSDSRGQSGEATEDDSAEPERCAAGDSGSKKRLAHQVLVINAEDNTIERTIDLSFAVPCDNNFELFKDGGRLWFNDLEGPMAGVLSPAGPTLVVDKVEQTTISGRNLTDGEDRTGDVSVVEIAAPANPNASATAGQAAGSGPRSATSNPDGEPGSETGDPPAALPTALPTQTGSSTGGQEQSSAVPTDTGRPEAGASSPVTSPGAPPPVTMAGTPPSIPAAGSPPAVTSAGVASPVPTSTIPTTVGPVAAGPGPEKKPAATTVTQPSAADALTANFTYSPPGEPTTETSLTFSDASSGRVDKWLWTFTNPEGVSSTLNGRSVTRSLPTVGLWTVTLTVSNAAGRVDTTRPVPVQVRNAEDLLPPNANFSWDPGAPVMRQGVTFKDRSTTGKNSPLLSWFWEFGDGTTATGQNPASKAYAQPGTYVVRLTVRNEAGAAWAESSLTVADLPSTLKADFTQVGAGSDPGVVVSGRVVSFTDTSAGGPTEWVWDFGDGSTATTPTAAHVYRSVGDVKVTLRVSNATGAASVTKTLRIVAPAEAPQSRIAEPSPGTKVEVGKALRFVSASTGGATKLVWNWGDGTTTEGTTATKIFTRTGSFEVELIASNAAGSTSSTVAVTVTAVPSLPPLLPSFRTVTGTSSADPAVVGEPVRFINTSTGAGTFEWDFGDGSKSTDRDPTYTFKKVTTFRVTLTMTGGGRSAQAKGDVFVGPAPVAVVANFDYTPKNPTVAQAVTFADQTTGTPSRWTWSFGDATPVFTGQKPPPKTYDRAGQYDVTLTVVDRNGAITTKTQTVAVQAAPKQPPAANFNVEPADSSSWVVGKALVFVDETPSTSTSPLTTPVFTFDSATASPLAGARRVEHIFTTAGSHLVTMKVCWVDDLANCAERSKTITINAQIQKPDTSFVVKPGPGVLHDGRDGASGPTVGLLVAGTDVTFEDTTPNSRLPDWSTEWTIGAKKYDAPSVTLSLANAGSLNVSLTVTNPAGAKTVSQDFRVLAATPVAAFSPPAQVEAKTPAPFSDDSTNVPADATRTWAFGDGTGQVEGTQTGTTHVFEKPGTYSVTLTITVGGYNTSATKNVVVRPGPAPTPKIQATNLLSGEVSSAATITVGSGAEVLFTDLSATPVADQRTWSWSDGAPNASGPIVQRNFSTVGEVRVTLVSKNDGGSTTMEMLVKVVAAGPSSNLIPIAPSDGL